MREFSSPLTVDLPTGELLTDHLLRNATEHPSDPVLAIPSGTTWNNLSAADFLSYVRDIARGLIAAGVAPGDRVALMSRTRWEWTVVDYAIWYAGAVCVPIFETASPEQVEAILHDSSARAIVVGSPRQTNLVQGLREQLPQLRNAWELDGNALAVLTTLGGDVNAEVLEQARTAADADDPATIIYTSGTTGRPKGCVLSHFNLLAEVELAGSELEALFRRDAATLLVLPPAHVFARVLQIGAVRYGVRLGHSSGIARLPADLATFQPTFLLGVPRLFERLFNEASQQAAVAGRSGAFNRAVKTAIAYSQADGGPSAVLRGKHLLAERLALKGFRQLLGGHCAYAICGGAPLGERLHHFYNGAGIPILEGYGLTETTAAVTANSPDANRIGTVGRPLPGVSARIADDGELLLRGPQVMTGYWQQPDATAELVHDGWLHTGDLAEIDAEGFVRITGRKREIIVTTSGKPVAPGALEDRLREHPLIANCLVVGDGQPFLAAMITLDPAQFTLWAGEHRKPTTLAGHTSDPDLLAEVQTAVDNANKAVSHAEAIRRFVILDKDWTEESGELTPSLKLKRNIVLRRHRRDIAALFDA